MSREFIYYCVVLFAVAPVAAAQDKPKGFVELSAGVVREESEFAVRAGRGVTAGLAIGREVGNELTLEGRFSASRFNAPAFFASPGGCLGASPCIFPAASNADVGTLGASGEYHQRVGLLVPLVLFGVGGRYLRESPQRGDDVRPYAEAGVGVMLGEWGVRARYQAAARGRDVPKWMIPVTLDYRF